MTFMPTRLPVGIGATDDPLLRARAGAYAAASLQRRR
jgi:catalase